MRRTDPVGKAPLARLLAGVGWALAAVATALAAAPAPALAQGKAAPLARYFPRENLAAYAEFDGLDNHADLWHKTAAYRLLTGTTTGTMLDQLATQLAGRAAGAVPGSTLNGAEIRLIAEHAARQGFAFGVARKPGERQPGLFGLVVRGGAAGKSGEVFKRVVEGNQGPAEKAQVVDRPGGRKLHVSGADGPSAFAWWAEGDDLVLTVGPAAAGGADLMIAALRKNVPDATGHPTYAALAKAGGGFTPVGLAFAAKELVPEMPPQAAALGLNKVDRLEYRWGFEGEALATTIRVVAPAPRYGLLSSLDQKPLGALAVPNGLAGFTAFSVDPVMVYDRVAAGFAASDPNLPQMFEHFEEAVRETTGHRLRDDVLPRLGPGFSFYAVPARANAPTNVLEGLVRGVFANPRLAVVAQVKERDKLAEVLADVMAKTAKSLQARAGEKAVPVLRVKPLDGVKDGYVLSVPPATLRLPAGYKPTVLLGKASLVIGSTPEAAKAALNDAESPAARAGADDPVGKAVASAPKGTIFLSVTDERVSLLPVLVANLPNVVQVIGSGGVRGVVPPFLRPGMPMPPGNGFQLDVDPDTVPSPDDLRPFLFPSRYTFSTDEGGFTFASREAFPALNPAAIAPVAAALLFPAVQASRSAARRAQSVNNLKQIGLAMHNFHSTNNHFPGTIRDKDGKPLLSWRVAILPFLEQQALYNEFHLDEPWDSEHNKPLLERMPAMLVVPGSDAKPGMTFYRGFSGEGTAFDPKEKEGVGIATVTDGTSNTIGVIEAKTAAEWTKPDSDIPFDVPANDPAKFKALLAETGAHFPGGFNALFLDGSVRFLKQTINPLVLRALITRNQGEVINADAF